MRSMKLITNKDNNGVLPETILSSEITINKIEAEDKSHIQKNPHQDKMWLNK